MFIYLFTIFVISSTILYKFSIVQIKKREKKAIFNIGDHINFIICMFIYLFTIFVINSTILYKFSIIQIKKGGRDSYFQHKLYYTQVYTCVYHFHDQFKHFLYKFSITQVFIYIIIVFGSTQPHHITITYMKK